MGATYLVEMADILRSVGVQVQELPGWQTTARSSGGYEVLNGISVHHTAESPLMDGWTSVDYMTNRHIYKPVCNLYLDRKGVWWVAAGGATNTSGKGGPLGDIPLDQANSRTIGLEIGNNGVGEPYPEVQQESLVKGLAALWGHYGKNWGWGLAPNPNTIFSHFEWAPGRKIDPFGPSRWTDDQNEMWDMDSLRRDVADYYYGVINPPVVVPSTPKVIKVKAWYYARVNSTPRRVATHVYSNPLLASRIKNANPGKWSQGQRLSVPGKVGLETRVMRGEGPYSILKRMGVSATDRNVRTFKKWNGGKSRVLLVGQRVFMPK